MSDDQDEVMVPPILKIGRRGVDAKIWAFLYVNEGRWFTAKEISGFLDMPLSTVQLALRQVLLHAPRVVSLDLESGSRGRPERAYSFQRILSMTDRDDEKVSRDVERSYS